MLDHIITSNHIHLLVPDRGKGEINQPIMTARYREAIVDKEDKWVLRETEAVYWVGLR